MADSLAYQVTTKIKNVLSAISGYGTISVSTERMDTKVPANAHYVEVCGPREIYEAEAYTMSTAEMIFTIIWYPNVKETASLSVVDLTKNVNRDVIKALQTNPTLDGLVNTITPLQAGYEFEMMEGRLLFFRWIEVSLQMVINTNDLSLYE